MDIYSILFFLLSIYNKKILVCRKNPYLNKQFLLKNKFKAIFKINVLLLTVFLHKRKYAHNNINYLNI